MSSNLQADRFFAGMQGKTAAFIGFGVSHRDVVKQFMAKGVRVQILDRKTREQMPPEALEAEKNGAVLKLGDGYLDGIDADLILRTPGFRYYHPALEEARNRNIAVTSEMELFFQLCPCPIIAVTGSDGKTTTTTLIARLLEANGYKVHLGGNIGKALLPCIEEIAPEDFAVVELSSFQLISMRQSPQIAVITNIAPNHLDIHKDMQEYIDAKKNILLHQNALSKTVLNADNEITCSLAADVRGRCYWFSLEKKPQFGAYLAANGVLTMVENGKETPILAKEEIRIPGMHNVANYLTAITAVWDYVSPESIVTLAKTFGGVEHRIEFVREVNGVKYYNDSIATSPTRAIAGLNSFRQKLILLAGGYDKKIPFEPLAPKLLEKVKLLILTGATADKIEQCVRNCDGFAQSGLRILRAKDLEESVQLAKANAVPGDIVSLSPACASFDSYPNFEVRGQHFKRLVNSL